MMQVLCDPMYTMPRFLGVLVHGVMQHFYHQQERLEGVQHLGCMNTVESRSPIYSKLRLYVESREGCSGIYLVGLLGVTRGVVTAARQGLGFRVLSQGHVLAMLGLHWGYVELRFTQGMLYFSTKQTPASGCGSFGRAMFYRIIHYRPRLPPKGPNTHDS